MEQIVPFFCQFALGLAKRFFGEMLPPTVLEVNVYFLKKVLFIFYLFVYLETEKNKTIKGIILFRQDNFIDLQVINGYLTSL